MGTTEKAPIFAQIVSRKGITVPSRALPMRVRLVLYGFVYSLNISERHIPAATVQTPGKRGFRKKGAAAGTNHSDLFLLPFFIFGFLQA